MILQKKSNFNVHRLGKEYTNLMNSIRDGKRVRFKQGDRKVYIRLPWNTSQRATKEKLATELLHLLSKNKNIYDSEKHREPAIKTINENNVLVYMPLSKTGLSLYEIEKLRQ